MSSKEILWHNLTIQQVLKELKSSFAGLSKQEANKLRIKYGLNLLPKKKSLTKLDILINQFKNALVYVLLLAGLISFVLGESIDALVIFTAVFINVAFGFIQENKAQNALEKLHQLITPEAKVIRDGLEEVILARDIVPGDIIILEAGDKIPADARLIKEQDLEIMEAALTGEPQTVEKHVEILEQGKVLAERSNMVYLGTMVQKGKGQAVVVATGIRTQLGKIAQLVRDLPEESTPLQKKLNAFSRNLSYFILSLSGLILFVGLIRGNNFLVMFNTAVAVAVAAIPEGLLVAVTVILAIGMQRILRKQALIRKLVGAETLGSTTVICTDKTGTLTEGEMRAVAVVTNSYKIDIPAGPPLIGKAELSEVYQAVKIGLLANDAFIQKKGEMWSDWQVLGSATDKALILLGAQLGFNQADEVNNEPQLDEILFDSTAKFMATLNKVNKERNVLYFKGAPEILLQAASKVQVGDRTESIYQPKRRELKEKYERLSKEGLRVLALGYKEVASDIVTFKGLTQPLSTITLVGFVGIKDPLRPDVKETLLATTKAGIKTVIITGDNKLTAKAIAKDLALSLSDENIIEGGELAKLNDDELKKRVKDIKIYARVTPFDKLRIITAWQSTGAVVAMTGDGINDAPALKKADIGVALGSGTDVAKEAASLVLLNSNFKTILAAVFEGRIIYDNIKKVVLYLLSDSFSEVIIIFGSLLFGLPLPLLPSQILWINLITDSFPSAALALEPGEAAVLKEPPQERDKPILDAERRLLIGVISFITAATTLALFYYFWKIQGDLNLARTVVFAALGLDSLLYVFSCRTLRHSLFHINFFQNKYLLASVILGGGMQLMAIYLPFFQKIFQTVPLSLREWTLVLGVSTLVILVIELIKWIFLVSRKRKYKTFHG